MKKQKQIQDAIAVIEEIHEKVLTAGERCLAEAQQILNSDNSKTLVELKELASIGFSNSKEVKEATQKIEEIHLASEKAKLIQYYATHYHEKFILSEDMEKICEEYGLFLGSDKHYIGSIPSRSRKEILSFKLKEQDHIFYRGEVQITKAGVKESEGVINWHEISKEEYMKQTSNGQQLIQNGRRRHYISNNDYWMIAAPMDMFDMAGLKADGVKLKEIVKVDDPVALKPVKYGYLIASVWGKEIAIERLMNERNN